MKLNRKITLGFLIPWLIGISVNYAVANNNCNLPEEINNVETDMEHYTVFQQGKDSYHTFRIPAIVQAQDGTLIAIAEARRDNAGDPGHGHIDLVYKLSYDGGRNWSSLRMFEKSQEGWSASNPTTVVKNSSGRIMVLYNIWKPKRGGGNSRTGTLDNQLWIRYSDDNGRTWSDAEDITHQGRDVENWNMTVFGPSNGIETSTGRLIIPSYANAPDIFGDSAKTAVFALYSDDGGRSWKRGQQISAYTNENQMVKLDDGRLMIDARQGDRIDNRWVAFSNDQGETWGEPEQGQLCAPIAASIISYPGHDNNNNSILLWSGIKGPGRTNLIVRLSSDQGQSFPVELLIGPVHAAYSVLTLIDSDAVGLIWEGGEEYRYNKIIFTRIPKNVIMNLDQLSRLNRSIN